MNTILVISPHPDDEAIGCGGTICKHIDQDDKVHIIFLTSGEKGGHGRSENETIMIREQEAKKASEVLRAHSIEFWHYSDGSLTPSKDILFHLISKLKDLQPNYIYVPHEQEQHPDHQAAAALVRICLNQYIDNYQPQVLMYEIWTPIQQLDVIYDITKYVNQKRQAILCYKSQCEVMDFEQAILGLNRYRGEMHCWPEGDYAEVFQYMHQLKPTSM